MLPRYDKVTDFASAIRYLDELKRYPVVTETEFKQLLPKAKSGDRQAFQWIVQGNLRFVVKTALDFGPFGVPLDELIAEGNVGLIKAVERFDPSLGYQFTTYAVWWIRNGIQKAIRNHRYTVRMPTNRLEDLDRIRKTADELSQQLGRSVGPEETVEFTEMTGARLEAALSSQSGPASLDAPVEGSVQRELYDYIPAEEVLQDEVVAQAETESRIGSAISQLNDREARIVELAFGFDRDKPMTLTEIGHRMGISKERVRQLRNRAVARLRDLMGDEELLVN